MFWLTVVASVVAGFPDFVPHVITDDMPGAYCIRAADVDGDGKVDVIAQGREVVWFKNPTWERFPIVSETRGNIFLAPADLTGDGLPEIVLASDFGLAKSSEGGTLTLFERKADLQDPWTGRKIGAEPTAHRLYWAELDGEAPKELLVSPIIGHGAIKPAYDQSAVELVAYFVPRDLDEPWQRRVIDRSLHVSHAVQPIDFDADGRDEILIVGYEGVFLLDGNGASWTKTKLGEGYQSEPAPKRGASEVALGHLSEDARFIATTEPWHGHQVVVYRPGAAAKPWTRHVIDDALVGSHALTVADFNGDGIDEIVAGYRGEGTSLYGYSAESGDGAQWSKHIIDDGGIAAQRCEAVDIDGDGDLDLIASGGSTHNVKWYENRSQ